MHQQARCTDEPWVQTIFLSMEKSNSKALRRNVVLLSWFRSKKAYYTVASDRWESLAVISAAFPQYRTSHTFVMNAIRWKPAPTFKRNIYIRWRTCMFKIVSVFYFSRTTHQSILIFSIVIVWVLTLYESRTGSKICIRASVSCVAVLERYPPAAIPIAGVLNTSPLHRGVTKFGCQNVVLEWTICCCNQLQFKVLLLCFDPIFSVQRRLRL